MRLQLKGELAGLRTVSAWWKSRCRRAAQSRCPDFWDALKPAGCMLHLCSWSLSRSAWDTQHWLLHRESYRSCFRRRARGASYGHGVDSGRGGGSTGNLAAGTPRAAAACSGSASNGDEEHYHSEQRQPATPFRRRPKKQDACERSAARSIPGNSASAQVGRSAAAGDCRSGGDSESRRSRAGRRNTRRARRTKTESGWAYGSAGAGGKSGCERDAAREST